MTPIMKDSRTLISQTPERIGKQVNLCGWVDSKRDHGKVTFIDLRDKSGKIQCVGVGKMGELSTESVVSITGMVKSRPENMVNEKIVTGGVEIEVLEYEILNKAQELPISVDGDGLDLSEEVRLKYRYLDLRRERMQKILRMRSKFINSMRKSFLDEDFVEIETPLLSKATKEGARDFIVPSRFQAGKFYALPQSPQQYKQLLMTAGFERYFQLARCLRDEDLRSDRGFEFTQLDLEMSFVEEKDVMNMVERVVAHAVQENGGKLKDQKFPVITHADAKKKYGADRFDLRTESEKEAGVLAFAWVVDFPMFKKVDKADVAEVRDGKSGWTFEHNPFCAPRPEFSQDHARGQNLENIIACQYDLVCNGYEVGGGSVRAHDPEVLKKTFEIMGYTEEQIEEGIGHMLRAFTLGTPPHGGLALGVDRLVMLLAGEKSLKETMAFPMTSSGRTAVMDAPAEVSEDQLDELSLKVVGKVDLSVHDAILLSFKNAGISYKYLVHEPVYTSQEAANVRAGESLSQGAKALVLVADKEYVLFVLPGDKRADLDKLQKILGVKKLVMASRDSVKSKTGLEVGAIPPFGSAMGLRSFVDKDLLKNDEIVFNVGRHDRSALISSEDYLRVEKAQVVE